MRHVGIFWFVPSNIAGTSTIVTDLTPLAPAPGVRGMVTHRTSHKRHWAGLAALGVRELRRRGLPIVIAMVPFDEYPRGDVRYDQERSQFEVDVDPKLCHPPFIGLLRAIFGIDDQATFISSGRYRSRCETIPLPTDCL